MLQQFFYVFWNRVNKLWRPLLSPRKSHHGSSRGFINVDSFSKNTSHKINDTPPICSARLKSIAIIIRKDTNAFKLVNQINSIDQESGRVMGGRRLLEAILFDHLIVRSWKWQNKIMWLTKNLKKKIKQKDCLINKWERLLKFSLSLPQLKTQGKSLVPAYYLSYIILTY